MAGTFYTGHCCREVPQAVSATSKAEDKSTVWSILRNSTLLKLLISSFLLFLLTSQLYSVLSVYATGVVGVSRDTLGLVYSVNGFTIIFFQLPVTQLLDRIRMHQSLRLLSGAALYALGYFSLAFCTGGWSLGTAVFVLTLGEVIVQPALFTQVSRLAPQGGVGRSMATLGLVRGIGMAVGPWIGSLVFQSYSGAPLILWGILSSFAVIAGIGFLAMRTASEQQTN